MYGIVASVVVAGSRYIAWVIAKVISNAKVFSLVNELRIIKKVNLLKISTSRDALGHKT